MTGSHFAVPCVTTRARVSKDAIVVDVDEVRDVMSALCE